MRERPLSVLHLLAPADFGGMESVVVSLAHAQSAAGHRVAVAALIPPREGQHPFVAALADAGIPARVISVGARDYLGERKSVGRLVAEEEWDVLHTHGYRPDVVDSGVARAAGAFTVTTVHGFTGLGLRGRLYEWAQIRSFRRFGAVVAVSDPIRARLVRSGVEEERLHVVRNAWRPLKPLFDRAAARQSLGIGTHEPVVGWIGRLSPEKGPDVMLEALAALGHPHLTLLFVGTGPMRSDLMTQARRLGVEHQVRFYGPLIDAGRYVNAFDAVVLSSRTEGTPMVVLEAMAGRVPLVATAVGGVPDVVTDGEAILVPPEDPAAAARALATALAGGVEGDSRVQAARDRLERDFSVEAWAARYSAVYRAGV